VFDGVGVVGVAKPRKAGGVEVAAAVVGTGVADGGAGAAGCEGAGGCGVGVGVSELGARRAVSTSDWRPGSACAVRLLPGCMSSGGPASTRSSQVETISTKPSAKVISRA
jgi:hypothetical protein